MHAYDTRIRSGHALFIAMCMWSMAGVTVGAMFVVGLEDDVGVPFELIALAMASGQFDIYDSSVREAVGGLLRSHGVHRTAGQSPMQLLQGLSPSQVTAIGSDVLRDAGRVGRWWIGGTAILVAPRQGSGSVRSRAHTAPGRKPVRADRAMGEAGSGEIGCGEGADDVSSSRLLRRKQLHLG